MAPARPRRCTPPDRRYRAARPVQRLPMATATTPPIGSPENSIVGSPSSASATWANPAALPVAGRCPKTISATATRLTPNQVMSASAQRRMLMPQPTHIKTPPSYLADSNTTNNKQKHQKQKQNQKRQEDTTNPPQRQTQGYWIN